MSANAEPRPLLFPAADAVQPHQPVQWWYWSGQLTSEQGRRYGFQLAMFAAEAIRGLVWGQMAHWAIVDLERGEFVRRSRIWLGAPERIEGRFLLSTRDGQARACGGDGRDRLRLQLPGFELDLHARGGPLVQHYDGHDHSYAFGGNSYYYSRPRMHGTGVLRSPRGAVAVAGEVWFDRQFGALSSALLEGWQWLSIHLDRGEQLMVFGFNRTASERFAAITDADGQTRWLGSDAFELRSLESWRSPHSRVLYPIAWELRTDHHRLEIRTRVREQEMGGRAWLGPIYWEGACEVTGSHAGRAYVELLGSPSPGLTRHLRGRAGRALLHPPIVLGLATCMGWGAARLPGLRPRFDAPCPEPREPSGPTTSTLEWREAAGL